jgi:hypothetical protein
MWRIIGTVARRMTKEYARAKDAANRLYQQQLLGLPRV